jgi:hypothetical protein
LHAISNASSRMLLLLASTQATRYYFFVPGAKSCFSPISYQPMFYVFLVLRSCGPRSMWPEWRQLRSLSPYQPWCRYSRTRQQQTRRRLYLLCRWFRAMRGEGGLSYKTAAASRSFQGFSRPRISLVHDSQQWHSQTCPWRKTDASALQTRGMA